MSHMLKQCIRQIRGVLTTLWYAFNTLFWLLPFAPVALIKIALPFKYVHRRASRTLDGICSLWVKFNNTIALPLTRTRIHVIGNFNVSKQKCYMLISNHQSWVDIFVLQRIFHNRIPFLKFFIKKELLWMPFLGFIWWALDYPIMRRYSQKFLEKYPHLRGKDLAMTQKSCDKFKELPVTVTNFVEGTRFTPEKSKTQDSPFKHLLKPRAGGVAFALSAMGKHLHELVDVTICYPKGAPSFWDFVCGHVKDVRVKVQLLPIDDKIVGDYINNPAFKITFQQWLNTLWQDKDNALTQLYTLNNK